MEKTRIEENLAIYNEGRVVPEDHALADGYFQRQCRLQCNQSADICASDAGSDHHLNLRLL